MKIETGQGTITLTVLLGIWSVSALTSLPGLAVSPILGKLSVVFPSASELDIQMLTSLPSLLIVPFVLLAGYFTEHIGCMRLLYWGLSLFLLSGVLYFLCNDMWQLISVSALLGVGAGIIIPLSTLLVSRFFSGDVRTRQFGYSSAITNMTLVLATALTGYLADLQWRLPFVVYLLPALSLLLVPAMSSADRVMTPRAEAVGGMSSVGVGIDYPRLLGYMAYYLLITYLTVTISFDLPFLMNEYGYDSEASGLLISLFFLSIMLPGFFLHRLLRLFSGRVAVACLVMIGVGLFMVYIFRSRALMALGCIVAGFGYGIAQPYLYDRTSSLAVPRRVSLALALLMAMNYVAILACPFIVDYAKELCHVDSERFAFGFNTLVTLLALVGLAARRVVQKYR